MRAAAGSTRGDVDRPAWLVIASALLLSLCASNERAARAGRPEFLIATLSEAVRPRQISLLELAFKPFVFGGDRFPPVDFRDPDTVRATLGAYRIDVRYFDRNYGEVVAPASPGRYGAVARVTFDTGLSLQRFYTLYHLPREAATFDWLQWVGEGGPAVIVDLPQQMGISRDVAQRHADEIGELVRQSFHLGLARRPYAARLLAGLYESEADQPAAEDLVLRDRRWWVALKRRLYGQPDAGAVRGPTRASAAPVVRDGTAAEAGMRESVVEELDAICEEWARRSEEAFAVAVARRGIIFFHRAYGQRDGRPMTIETPSRMASVHKVLTNILFLMLIDHGMLKMDDDLSRYLPALRDLRLPRPLTVRHLVSRTGGLPSLHLDELHDYDEILKIFLSHINPGAEPPAERPYALMGKLMEAISGKTTADFFAEHLIAPLGLEHTQVRGAVADARSTPGDMAKIAQLVLNGGSYGDLHYFGDSLGDPPITAFDHLAGPSAPLAAWLGLYWYDTAQASSVKSAPQLLFAANAGFGRGEVLGHGAASGATFALVPAEHLSIVITRDRRGARFAEYHERFTEAIARNLVH